MNTPFDTRILELESQAAAAAGLLHGLVVAAGTAKTLDVLWAWGAASVLPTRRTMSPDSVFDVASLTKVVATASACAVCIDRGSLVPDAPAIEYLPRLGQFPGSVIRVCDLASHCSGYDNRKFDMCAPERLVDMAIEAPPQWPARQRFEYSCRNFIVLGHIVERVTGEELATFCDRNVFAPLGMTHTVFGPIQTGLECVVPTEQPAGTISDGHARTHRSVGSAGLFSTARDLASFCQMMLRGGRAGQAHLFNAESLGWLTQPCTPPGLAQLSFGWDMRPCSECLHRPHGLSQAAIGHSGWTGQSLWVDPGLGLYCIILTNRTHVPGDSANYESSMRFRARLADIVISHLME